MNRARRSLVRLERSPWTLAVIAGAGATLLLPSVLALFGPLEWLDRAAAVPDAVLGCGLAGVFALSTALLRILLRRRRLAEEALDEEPAPAAPAKDAADVPATAARAHLR
jgi:hypothetical protein